MKNLGKLIVTTAISAAVMLVVLACNNPAGGDTTTGNNNNNQTQQCTGNHVWGDWERVRPGDHDIQQTRRTCTFDGCNAYETFTGGAFTQHSLIVSGDYFDKEMVRIPAGSIMGNTQSMFYMSRHQVTRAQWRTVPGMAEPSQWGPGNGNLPATHVNWFDAIEFANRLSIARQLTPVYSIPDADTGEFTPYPHLWGDKPTTDSGEDWDRWLQVRASDTANGYRLPTSSQWEYAARAGTTTLFNDGVTNGVTPDDLLVIYYLAWTSENSNAQIRAVGGRHPNAWGLYDMHGNVWEWCADLSGTSHVIRGGSVNSLANLATSAIVTYYQSYGRHSVNGFRLVRQNVN